ASSSNRERFDRQTRRTTAPSREYQGVMHMNTQKVEGKFDQVAGKIKQSVGEAVGNQKLANSGVADQVKGAAKETWGNAKDAAAVATDDARTRTDVKTEDYKE